MNLPDLSIKRPVFVACIFILIMALGVLSMKRLGLDLFPNVTFPIVLVTVNYPGASPQEVETLIAKPIEEEISTLSGIKRVNSTNKESISSIVVEFTMSTDIKYAEQKIRDRISTLKSKLPNDIQEPVIRSIDPADQPILILALSAELSDTELYDLADSEVRPFIEQVDNVGFVEVLGGRKREILVELDREKLKVYNLSASQVSQQLSKAGANTPAGKFSRESTEKVIRTLGEFQNIWEISSTIVSFHGNEVPVRVTDVGSVKDSLEDEKNRTYINGKPALTLRIFRQSGANTVAVVDSILKKLKKINSEMSQKYPNFSLKVVRDGSRPIRANLDDVSEAIILGILLTVIVVYLFLGSFRSTFITGMALPNSLLGAFLLMALAGFTINIMTLLAMSLAVGLLIDDAIVVRENIFRHLELGKTPREAASIGTNEVSLAVVATTLTVIAVFGPVAFLDGMVGQFFKEFGLTICFAMAVSLFDALTMAPMLSAYFAGRQSRQQTHMWGKIVSYPVQAFDRLQTLMETFYEKILQFAINWKLTTLLLALATFVSSLMITRFIPKTFVPPQDTGEFELSLELPPGSSLEAMNQVTQEIDEKIRSHKEVDRTVVTVGGGNGESNEAGIFIALVPSKQRNMNTSQFKEIVRSLASSYSYAEPKVQDVNAVGGAKQQPFNVNISGTDTQSIYSVAKQLYDRLKTSPHLEDVAISYKTGKPEFQVILDKKRSEQMGVSSAIVGGELRTLIEGSKPAVFRENGNEYDIRVRLQEKQRDIKMSYDKLLVPNINNRLIRLSHVSKPNDTLGPATIQRENRARFIQVSAGISPSGQGMAAAMAEVENLFSSQTIKLPNGISYGFVGSAESFKEMVVNMAIAALMGILFIYLVLASLYESFMTPFTILLVLPLAACGAFYGLLIGGGTIDIFSMIGCILLMGIATKNSILLVDYIKQRESEGIAQKEAILEAGKVRFRPIIMTSIALIAGMIPIAVGLNEASKQRTSMGIAVIGGLVSSTLLTLVVIPAAYSYLENIRTFLMNKVGNRIITSDERPDRII